MGVCVEERQCALQVWRDTAVQHQRSGGGEQISYKRGVHTPMRQPASRKDCYGAEHKLIVDVFGNGVD